MPREGSQLICLSVILIDSVFRTGKSSYPQVFFEEWKFVVTEKKIPKHIIDDVELSCDSDKEHSDIENSREENSCKENFDKENYYYYYYYFCVYQNLEEEKGKRFETNTKIFLKIKKLYMKKHIPHRK